MNTGRIRRVAACVLAAATATLYPIVTPAADAPAAAGAPSASSLSHGRFKNVQIIKPQGAPKGVTMLFSGDKGWTAADRQLADTLAAQGSLVAGIDTNQLFAQFDADDGKCVFPDGDLENLSRLVQAYEKLQGYTQPVIMAQPGRGANLAYALSVQASPKLFAGTISLGFCPELQMKKALCTNDEGPDVPNSRPRGSKSLVLEPAPLQTPWVVVPPQDDAMCKQAAARDFIAKVPKAELASVDKLVAPDEASVAQIAALYQKVNAGRAPDTPMPPATVADLPVIEIPATAGKSDLLVILLSGDGGWASIDKEVAAALAANGVPVIGFDSLRYFWSKRTPESTAVDVDRLIRYYLSAWKKRRAVLVGFSQGADVLPFIVNRLPATTLEHVSLATFLSLGKRADFEFKLTNWVSSSKAGMPIQPEIDRFPAGLGFCVYGAEDKDSLCPSIPATRMMSRKFPGGHHFDGNNTKVATTIIEAALNCEGPREALCKRP
jgi:type IV secretory pathway VirJ component